MSVYVQGKLSVPADMKLVTEEVDVPARAAKAGRTNNSAEGSACEPQPGASLRDLFWVKARMSTQDKAPCALEHNDNMNPSSF
jgi:hypothetical protein